MPNIVLGKYVSLGIYGASRRDQSDFEPGPKPSRSIFTPRASRAERITLVVRPCSRAMRLTSAAGPDPPAKAALRNSIASALVVLLSEPAASAASASSAVIDTGSVSHAVR